MTEPKIKPSDLEAEAQRLIAEGKMPNLDDLLGAVAAARQKYGPQIIKSRKHAGVEALREPS